MAWFGLLLSLLTVTQYSASSFADNEAVRRRWSCVYETFASVPVPTPAEMKESFQSLIAYRKKHPKLPSLMDGLFLASFRKTPKSTLTSIAASRAISEKAALQTLERLKEMGFVSEGARTPSGYKVAASGTEWLDHHGYIDAYVSLRKDVLGTEATVMPETPSLKGPWIRSRGDGSVTFSVANSRLMVLGAIDFTPVATREGIGTQLAGVVSFSSLASALSFFETAKWIRLEEGTRYVLTDEGRKLYTHLWQMHRSVVQQLKP